MVRSVSWISEIIVGSLRTASCRYRIPPCTCRDSSRQVAVKPV